MGANPIDASNMPPLPKFVIVDGNAILHRAFHALPPLATKEGVVVNAVYGFITTLLKVLRELKPRYLAVTFDVAGPTFRDKIYKEYKAQRAEQPQELYNQLPILKDLLQAFSFKIFEKTGFEADDIIATLAKKETGSENIIVTGDLDTLQLVDDRTKVYTLKKGVSEIITYDPKAVKERYGLKPEQLIDYKALRGDPSDNIPGVRGIGEKIAAELIKKFGSIEELFRAVKSGRANLPAGVLAKLKDSEDTAFFSKKLVALVSDVPLKFDIKECQLGAFDLPKITKKFLDLGFTSIIKRLSELAPPGVAPAAPLPSKIKVKSIASLAEVKKKITAAGLISGAAGLWLCLAKNAYFLSRPGAAASLLEEKELALMGHDLKEFLKIVFDDPGHQFQIPLARLGDTKVMDYLLDPGRREASLRQLIWEYLNVDVGELPQPTLFGAPDEAMARLACYLLELGPKIEEKLKERNQLELYEKIEAPLITVLARIENNGVKIDLELLSKTEKKLTNRLAQVEEKIFNLAGEKFNIASPQQLKRILFEKLQIPSAGLRKGKTGLSTAASELLKMRGLHPIIDLIFEYRELSKLLTTYVRVLPKFVRKDGRLYTHFHQTVTSTGRLSSSEPNLQNIPIEGELGQELRRAFVATRGFKLLSIDYSQLELRIVASLANDQEMIEVFRRGEDVHVATAAKINNVPIEEVTKEMRQAAKAVNFGIIYGMGPAGLAETTGLSLAEAKEFIAKYFEAFRGVKEYMRQTVALAHSLGYVETLLGRRRYLPDINSGIFQVRQAAERMAINAPVQGTNADMIKLAMIEIDKLIGEKYRGEAKMIIQVHDELVFEAREGLVEKFAKEAALIMENVVKLKVPVKVEAAVGGNWGEMEPLDV